MTRHLLPLLVLCAVATGAQAQAEDDFLLTDDRPVTSRRVEITSLAPRIPSPRALPTRVSVTLTDVSGEFSRVHLEPGSPTGRLLASLAGRWVQVRSAWGRKLRDLAVEGRVRPDLAGVLVYSSPDLASEPLTKLAPGEIVWCQGASLGWLACKGGFVRRLSITFSRRAPQQGSATGEETPETRGATGVLRGLGN